MLRCLVVTLLLCVTLASVAAGRDPFVVPPGYVLQVLEPIGGKIARPAGWFYAEKETPSGFVWTISREDPATGPYRTGMRIQLLTRVAERMQQTPESLVRAYIADKKLQGKVLGGCEEARLDLFTRICLETEETITTNSVAATYHVLYSGFWSEALDMAVVATFGAPADQWPRVESIAATMSEFELLDPNRFQ